MLVEAGGKLRGFRYRNRGIGAELCLRCDFGIVVIKRQHRWFALNQSGGAGELAEPRKSIGDAVVWPDVVHRGDAHRRHLFDFDVHVRYSLEDLKSAGCSLRIEMNAGARRDLELRRTSTARPIDRS